MSYSLRVSLILIWILVHGRRCYSRWKYGGCWKVFLEYWTVWVGLNFQYMVCDSPVLRLFLSRLLDGSQSEVDGVGYRVSNFYPRLSTKFPRLPRIFVVYYRQWEYILLMRVFLVSSWMELTRAKKLFSRNTLKHILLFSHSIKLALNDSCFRSTKTFFATISTWCLKRSEVRT